MIWGHEGLSYSDKAGLTAVLVAGILGFVLIILQELGCL